MKTKNVLLVRCVELMAILAKAFSFNNKVDSDSISFPSYFLRTSRTCAIIYLEISRTRVNIGSSYKSLIFKNS